MKYSRMLALFAMLSLCAGCEEEKAPGGGDVSGEADHCPDDPEKTLPGVCGCGKADDDSDGDTIPDCYDVCSEDAGKIEPGICGCGKADEVDEATGVVKCLAGGDTDLCPDDPGKTLPGVCGCGKADADADGDGVYDCMDMCPEDPSKTNPGVCGCGNGDEDSDGDGFFDCQDKCRLNAEKILPGLCGCDVADTAESIADEDGDGTINCLDLCPKNPNKTAPGEHGCDSGDSDGDGVDDVDDACPFNPKVTKSGTDCNIVEENGVKVFEVYSGAEMIALRKAVSENMPEHMLGMPCDPKNVTDMCLENTQSATRMLTCARDSVTERNVFQLKECYSGCVQMDPAVAGICVVGSAPVAQPPASCTETDTPSRLYDCCTAENFSPRCDGDSILECKDGMVKVRSACTGSTPVCHEAACVKYIPVADDASNKGQLNTQCDADEFKSRCDGSSMLICSAERVQKIACVNGCSLDAAEGSAPLCVAGAPRNDRPVLKIRLMKDINLADGLDVKKDNWGCFGDWSPISLNQMSFEGGGHKVAFSKDGKSCSLTRPFFDYVTESLINDVSFQYNIQGEASAAVAHMGVRSVIRRVKYDGGIKLGTSLVGESRGEVFGILGYSSYGFGTILSSGHDTDIEDVEVSGSLSSLVSYLSAGIVAGGGALRVDGGKVSFSLMDCGKVECVGGVYGGAKADVRKLDVDIESVKSGPVFSGIGKEIQGLSSSGLTVGNIAQNEGSSTTVYAAAGKLTGQVANAKVKLDKAGVGGEFYGVSPLIQSNVRDLEVELGEIEAGSFVGISGSAGTSDLENVAYTLASARATTGGCVGAVTSAKKFINSKFDIGSVTADAGAAYGFGRSDLDHVELKIGSVSSGTKAAFGVGDGLHIVVKDSSVSVGKVTAEAANAHGFANSLTGSIQNSEIDLGEVFAPKGIAFGMSATTTNTLEMTNAQIRAKRLFGTKAWGLCDTCAIVKLDHVGFDLGEVKGTANATPTVGLMRVHNGNSKNIAAWQNVAHYAVYYGLKAQPHVATTANYIKFTNYMDASQQFTVTAFEADGRAVSPAYQSAISLVGGLTGTTAANGYWLKRKDADKLAGKLTANMSGFVGTEVDTVISKFAGGSWVKKTFTEDDLALVLPWPHKK